MATTTAAPTTARAMIFALVRSFPLLLPGQPAHLQLLPQAQLGPQVHVPAALAGQAPVEAPHEAFAFPGQPTHAQLGPQVQTSPQVQVPAAFAGHGSFDTDTPQVPEQPTQRQFVPH